MTIKIVTDSTADLPPQLAKVLGIAVVPVYVRFGEHRLHILPTNGRLSYARARVEVQERMDGSLAVYEQGHCLATKQAPPEAPVLRVRKVDRAITSVTNSKKPAVPVNADRNNLQSKSRQHTNPSPNHPWRRPFKVHIDRG